MKLVKYSVLLAPLVVFGLLEFFLWHPTFFYGALFLAVITIFLAVFLVFKTKYLVVKDRKLEFANFCSLPIIFTVTMATYSIISIDSIVRQFLFFACLIFLYLYLKIFYYYINESKHYKVNSFPNIVSLGSFWSYFFLFSSVFGLKLFLGFSISIWPMVLVSLPFSFILAEIVMWSQGIKFSRSFLYLMIFCLTLVELMWSLSFLPLSHVAIGMIIAVFCYMIIDTAKLYLLELLSRKVLRFYLIFGFLCSLLIIFTAKWM